MSAPILPVGRSSFIVRDGDSINDYALPYGSMDGLLDEISSAQIAPVGASFRRALQRNYAHSGDTTANLDARKAVVDDNATTHYFGQAGINDIQTGVPLGPGPGSSIDNVTSIVAFMVARGIAVMWIGPFCLGELQPDGANPFDAQIAAWDAAIAPIVDAHPGCAYVSIRNGVWVPQEPIYNVPGPPGVSSGILCQFNASPPFGIHPNPTGNRLITPVTKAVVPVT